MLPFRDHKKCSWQTSCKDFKACPNVLEHLQELYSRGTRLFYNILLHISLYPPCRFRVLHVEFKISASLCSTSFEQRQITAQTTLCGIGLKIHPSTCPCLKISLFSRVLSHSPHFSGVFRRRGWSPGCSTAAAAAHYPAMLFPDQRMPAFSIFFSWLQCFQHFQGLELVK